MTPEYKAKLEDIEREVTTHAGKIPNGMPAADMFLMLILTSLAILIYEVRNISSQMWEKE